MVRVYSAYLSTLTGTTTQAVFTAKLDTATTTLNVTAVASGTLAVSQYITINGVVNQILQQASVFGTAASTFTATITTPTTMTVVSGGTGLAAGQFVLIQGHYNSIASGTAPNWVLTSSEATATVASYSSYATAIPLGNTGTYTLATAAALNATGQTYTTYTYTPTPSKYAPINKYNLNSMTWAVNWREIFGNRNGECRCKVRIMSNSNNNLTWLNNVGSIRASLSSSTSNNTNGVNIGFVRPQSDFIATQSYIDCDTTTSDGITVLIPTSNTNLSIYLLNANETPMVNVPDYQVWLYFEVDDEDPYDKKDINQGSSSNIFRPV